MGAVLKLTKDSKVIWTWAGAILSQDLGPGGLVEIATPAEQKVILEAGLWNVETFIDDQKIVPEANELNNTQSKIVSIYSVQVMRKPGYSYSLDLVLRSGVVIQACLHDWLFPANSSKILFEGTCDNGAKYDLADVTRFIMFYSTNNWLSATSVSSSVSSSKLDYIFAP
jgi:hypothetical protein